ncbi:hypothetical protein D9611_001828 [Ephemerocybe angulata]|uniref:Protein FRA10AC1 n=1 Tax=Ephemerocybe angulata TaxID=980116 RepID=A0A8H5CI96_9AGAR|nr:hypothetical protein D9611_001828 [Tulosesus angulatus]
MSSYLHDSSSSKIQLVPTGITEFEILKARHNLFLLDPNSESIHSLPPSVARSHRHIQELTIPPAHRFLREDTEEGAEATWDDQLARKYYDSLYREFAVCDLKHYKSGNFSLRWRTEDEVLDGTGETTCGNSRCEYHNGPSRYREVRDLPPLTTLELPFAYSEQGENKSALVKVVLCPGCVKKLMWKRTKEKEKQAAKALASERSGKEDGGVPDNGGEERREGSGSRGHSRREASRRGSYEAEITGNTSSSSRRRRHSRSRSPRRIKEFSGEKDRRRSPTRPSQAKP